MARFVTGEEISSVEGAIEETFIEERAVLGADAGGEIAGSGAVTEAAMGASNVDDAVAVPRPAERRRIAQLRGDAPRHRQPEQNRFEINGDTARSASTSRA